jgi:tetratricopeptide (TPR) repeat protein
MAENNEQTRLGHRAENPSGKHLARRTDRRLDTWKEIGAFFGRDERTVKRWEDQRGLPVHRVPGSGRGSVYAYTSELAEWLKTADDPIAVSTEVDETVPTALLRSSSSVPVADQTSSSQIPAIESPRKSWIWLWLAAAIVLALCMGGAWAYARHRTAEGKLAATSVHPTNPEAEELYLKGIYYWHKRTPDGLTQAVDYFTQSIVRDPNYAPAYVGLADCYNLLREYTKMPPEEAYPRAMAAAKRAIALDDSLSGAHSSLAFVDFYWSWDSASAEREFKRALELDPNSVVAHHWYATFLMHMGRFQEAIAEIEQAQKLDPSSIAILADKGDVLWYAGRTEEAFTLLKQLEQSEPDFLSPHNYLASIYLGQKNYAAFLKEARKFGELLNDPTMISVADAGDKGYASGGGEGMLRAMLARRKELDTAGHGSPYVIATLYGRLGENEEALKYLEEAVAKRDERSIAMGIDASFAGLHKDPQFQKLLAQVGLTPVN